PRHRRWAPAARRRPLAEARGRARARGVQVARRERGARGAAPRRRGDGVDRRPGAATAWAARRHGARAIVFVPEAASATKLALMGAQGAELRRVGADLDAAKDAARAYAAETGAFFFEDGAEPAQMVAYEAIGDELLDELLAPAAVVVPVVNGA